MSSQVEIRQCHSLPEFDACVRLQLIVWGKDIVVPSPVFVVAEHTGGFTHGAFIGSKMVGFSMAFAAHRHLRPFLHSHMAAVLPEYQNSGIGRQLKLAQRQDALRAGIALMEWTFDPLEYRNAHFNLVRLGAVVRRFIPDCYGITESPLHAGLPTDRLIAEWWLDSARVHSILGRRMSPKPPEEERVSLPGNLAEIKQKDRAAAARIQSQAAAQFEKFFVRGFVATSVEARGTSFDYILEPAASIDGLALPDAPAEVHSQ
ncbi:MAG: GNAT family N-acetyltransferase [Candidatus Acidiferrales bacterium]